MLPPATEVGFTERLVTTGAVIVRLAKADDPLTLAVTFAVAAVATGVVLTVAVPVVAPAAMVAVPLTVAEPLSEATVTVRPPVGAGLETAIVAVLDVPPTTDVGLSPTVVTVGAVMARFAVAVDPLKLAVNTAVAFAATGVVVTVKVPEVAPAAIVAVPGTAAGLPEETGTVRPPAGAALPIVTVPMDETPPATVVGLTDRPVTTGAVIARLAAFEEPFELAVMFAVRFDATELVVIVNVPVVAPAAIVAVPGTAAPLSDDTVTVNPPTGAADEIVIVPVELTPPSTVVGFNERAETVGPCTNKLPGLDVPFAIPLMVAVVSTPTATVVMLNVADVAPAAIVTDAGTVTEALFDASVILSPPVGAGLEIVTVPTDPLPPSTVVGSTVKLATVGALIVRAAFAVVTPVVPEMFATTFVETPDVVTFSVPVDEPAGIVIEPPICAAALSDAVVIVTPPAGAVPVSVNVATEPCPPRRLWGLSTTVPMVGARIGRANLNDAPKAAAVKFAVTLLVTGTAVTVNVPVVEPEGTDVVAGTVTVGERSDVNATANPAGGAAALSVSVPVIAAPPYAGLGVTVKPVNAIGLIVRLAV